MAKKIMQLHFPGDVKPVFENGWSKNLVEGKIVTSLGIYALPGTKFKIGQADNSNEEFIINGSGIFQINVENYPITSIKLNEISYNTIEAIGSHFIIIDIVYEGGWS